MSEQNTAPSTMRAWLYHTTSGPLGGKLQYHEDAVRPVLDATKDQLLIKVLAMSVNPVDATLSELGVLSRLLVAPPASPGRDFCGRIEALGPSVTEFDVGQLVFGMYDLPTKYGTLAEYIVVRKHCVAPLPPGVDVNAAATVGICGQTMMQAISKYVHQGGAVFINGGSGGTGTYGIQIAKLLGCRVTTSCSSANVDLCKSLGAEEVIDYTEDDVVEALRNRGQKYDLIVDNVGQPYNLYKECHHFLKPSGTFVQVGAQVNLSSAVNMFSRLLLPSLLGGGKRSFTFVSVTNSFEDKQKIAEWIARGELNPVIAKVFPFEEGNEAYKTLKLGRTKGKIIVRVQD